jgi:hypothetical protein
MSVAAIVEEKVSMIRELRSSGSSWDEVASRLSDVTGEEVQVGSLKAAYSRATRLAETPAPVEKVSKPRAVEKPNDIAKPVAKTDQTQGLKAALTAAEARASAALAARDSEREVVAKTAADRDRLAGEVERLKCEIERGKRVAEAGAEGKQDGEKDSVIDGLRVELAEALQAVERWEKWSEEQEQNAPRSRPILAVAAMVAALIVGAGAGGYGSRFLQDQEPVKVAAVATTQEVKPAPTKIESETKSEPVSGALNRPAGLPPIPPKPIVEGVLTSGKTISLLD